MAIVHILKKFLLDSLTPFTKITAYTPEPPPPPLAYSHTGQNILKNRIVIYKIRYQTIIHTHRKVVLRHDFCNAIQFSYSFAPYVNGEMGLPLSSLTIKLKSRILIQRLYQNIIDNQSIHPTRSILRTMTYPCLTISDYLTYQ